jgi:hypothetical protein
MRTVIEDAPQPAEHFCFSSGECTVPQEQASAIYHNEERSFLLFQVQVYIQPADETQCST